MSADHLPEADGPEMDALVRRALPPVAVSRHRLAGLAEAVVEAVSPCPAPAAAGAGQGVGGRPGLGSLLPYLAASVALGGVAAMAVATVLTTPAARGVSWLVATAYSLPTSF
jgi:hypothetical protein